MRLQLNSHNQPINPFDILQRLTCGQKMSQQMLSDPDAEPDHRGGVSVYLRGLAVQDKRAEENESVWAGSCGGWRGDGGENNLHHPSADKWRRRWVTRVLVVSIHPVSSQRPCRFSLVNASLCFRCGHWCQCVCNVVWGVRWHWDAASEGEHQQEQVWA